MKTIDSVNCLIKEKKAKVYTASEIKEMVRRGNIPSVDDVDVVTCGTFGVMSGTMAIISFTASWPGSFARAERIELNGVPGTPGPCPNKNLGIVDCVVYGTSRRDGRYGGGHLFRDIVNGGAIIAEATSHGKVFRKELTIDDMPCARMVATRGTFRSYAAFLNTENGSRGTIFSVTGMKGPMKDISVSGCGEIDPIRNDASSYLVAGAPVLLNGGHGTVLGPGTGSLPRPNLSAAADMRGMDAALMGGFITSAGPECMTSFTAAIPITDRSSLNGIFVLDGSIELPVAEIHTHAAMASASYGNVWEGTSRKITVSAERCLGCGPCLPENLCPVEALRPGNIDTDACVVCGTCVSSCAGGVFSADLGSIDHLGTAIPITLRQSDRNRAERSSEELKRMIEEGEWCL